MRYDAIEARRKRNKTKQRHHDKSRKKRQQFAYAIARAERQAVRFGKNFDYEGVRP